mmetsp:Transcript_31223/g.56677  ORF Transcript_31223/g.56677 Transcript_31223/m.56677 type:complete len:218 (-) Transcript_31223:296-949(-)|eukprot:CAMPEP_0175051696 /NCGR_PEP_ID=MMETSP0052_2-20121109/7952_1 /TAXON_ID=51329 ORGANISM="Polytomella parva, Strain SAG 63-3" /NCGR_SAMPLE_ID=MMETSP0052_2 /ASSEMBLY_ACC=CAM_ASM_000194 /LENGTH=217 /DNA_ID=CAMNT_0016316027 /DNA_START=43 /DNA_END=696 /DNA_ORIENTATION=-
MPLTLHYFPLPGKGEVSRLLLTVGGVDFVDKRHSDDWPEFKPKTPFGQMPVLEFENGELLAQSAAIELYAANIAGLIPKDPLAASRVVEAVNLFNEMADPIFQSMGIKDLEARIAKRKDLVATTLKSKFQTINNYVDNKTKNSPFLFGDKLTYADLALFNMMGMLSSGFFDGIPLFNELYADYPALKAHHAQVANVPSVKAFYEKETDDIRKYYRPQ